MKKQLLYTIGLLAMTQLTACSNDDASLPARQGAEIRAEIDNGAAARTVLGDITGETTTVYWSEDDAFALPIGAQAYTFTKKGTATDLSTASFECADAPALTPGEYTAIYPVSGQPSSYRRQPGTKESLKDYHYMTATFTAAEGDTWQDVNAQFRTQVAIVALTLKHRNFDGRSIKNVKLRNNGSTVATATATFRGDDDDCIQVFFAVEPQTFRNATVTAERGSYYSYTTSLSDITLQGGKLYRVNKSMAEDYDPPYTPPTTVAVTGVTLDKAEAEVNEGETLILVAQVEPSNATNKALEWSSSDESVATVDSNGKVTGVNNKTATITVKTKDGGYTATCVVKVNGKVKEEVVETEIGGGGSTGVIEW